MLRESQEGPIKISFDDIQAEFNKSKNEKELEFDGRNYFAKMEESQKAEEELNKRFTKNDFEKLKIVGQFNKGFIVARLDQDLFLIDQHACDEKFNFEKVREKFLETKKDPVLGSYRFRVKF